MYGILRNPEFHAFLFQIDQDLAGEVHSQGCDCGGRLHRANYLRKPRGAPPERGEAYDWRQSFCCAICRQRSTPPSVRFLGRRVYVGCVVVLISAMHMGLSARRLDRLNALVHVSRTTLYRWRTWWRSAFVQTSFWQNVRDRFLPQLAPGTLPGSLLDRFLFPDLHGRLTHCLRFLSPLTTRSPSTLAAGR